jgi:hypothetical protein
MQARNTYLAKIYQKIRMLIKGFLAFYKACRMLL